MPREGGRGSPHDAVAVSVFGSGSVSRLGGGGATPLTLVLLATVSTSLWLGHEAYTAARDHRAAVEATLRDYTGMAAREMSRLSEESLHWFVDEAFDDDRRSRRGDASEPGALTRRMVRALDWHGCACRDLRAPLVEFRIEHPARRVTLAPDTFDGAAADGLLRAAEAWITSPDAPRSGFVVADAGTVLAEPVAIGFRVRGGRNGETAVEAHGFVVPLSGVGQLVEHWYENHPLLPPLPGREEANDSLLHVRLETPGGAPVFASSGSFRPGLASRDALDPRWGGLRVEVNVRSGGADRLVAGGLPTSRTPLFLGMLLLVAMLGAAGLVQIRREQELARLRDDFVSGVSHELRTPLAQIRMFAELQGAGKLRTQEDRERAVSVIDREARRLSHLVENVLQFTSLRRAPAAHARAEPLDLERALQEAVDGFRPLLAEKDMAVAWEVEPGLRAQVPGGSMKQILVNLLDNAVKYGPRGQRVRVRAERAGARARIVVEDQGPGIPPEERRHIWAPYRRLERDVRGIQPGSGLGLAVVAALVRQHAGEVRLEDAPGGGARFVVEVPLPGEESARRKGGTPMEAPA